MPSKTLGTRQNLGGRADGGQSFFIETDQADQLDEIGHVERAGKACCAARGHDMAGAGSVVAQHLETSFAEENAPSVLHLVNPAPRAFDEKAEVLGRIFVGKRECFIYRASDDDTGAAAKSGGSNLPAFQLLQLGVDCCLYLLRQRSARCQEHGACKDIMLGLGQQVCCGQLRVGPFISNDNRFGWTWQAVDSNQAEESAVLPMW